MGIFDRIAQPDRAEGLSTATQEGQIPGWFPAVITDVNDPTGLQRVKVRSDLFDPTNDMPNGIDGWAVCLETTTGGNVGGVGSISPKYVGAQIAVLPMLGDPTQLLVLGCIPNRKEPPSVEFDRHRQLFGEASLGGTTKIHDDRTGASIVSTPADLITYSSAKGDHLTQTPGGAKITAFADGGISHENQNASSNITSTGDIKSGNNAGVSFGMTSDGKVSLEDKVGAGLALDGAANATFQGTRTPLAGTIKAIQRVLPGLLSQVSELIPALISNPENGILQGQLQDLLGQLPEAQTLLTNLSDFGTDTIGKSLLPQAQATINLGIDQIKPIAEAAIAVADPVDYLKKNLPLEQVKNLPDTLSNQLIALSHNPAIQVQAIISALIPEGFGSVKNILGAGLESLLPQVNTLLKSIPEIDQAIATPEEIEAWQKKITEVVGSIQEKLPNLDANSLVQTFLSGGDPYRTIIGANAVSSINSVTESISSLTAKLDSGIQGILKELDSLPQQLEQLNTQVSTMLNSLNSDERGGTLNLTEKTAEIKANPDGAIMTLDGATATIKPSQNDLAPSMQITMAQAALVGAGGSSRVFADAASAGLATAWGGFSFGSAGGTMKAIGSFAQTVVTKENDLSGSNFDLSGDKLLLSHGLKETPNHELKIDASGIFADGVNLADLSDPERFWAIYYGRIIGLISAAIAAIPPATPPTTP